MINVTEVSIEIVKPRDGLIGFANVVVDGKLFLGSIAIHKKLNADGYRLTYPKKNERQVFHPINAAVSKAIETAVFEKLKDIMKKMRYDRHDNPIDTSA